MAEISRCKGCGHPIVWMKTKTGKAMPVNKMQLTILTEQGDVVKGYESHFSTCPQADFFRKGK